MSRTLMHNEYHPSNFVTTFSGKRQITRWLQEQADSAKGEEKTLLEQSAAAAEMIGDDETYDIEAAEATTIANTIKEAATKAVARSEDNPELREHIVEFANALLTLSEQHEILHLTWV